MRLDQPIGILLLLWPTLWALWLAQRGVPAPDGALDLRSRHGADALGRVRHQRFRRPRLRRARRAHRRAPARRRRDRAVGSARGGRGARASRVRARAEAQPPHGRCSRSWRSPLPSPIRSPSASSAMPQAWLGHRLRLRHPDGVRRASPTRCRALAWGLLAANVFWTIAYDTEYAMVDRDDDVEARHQDLGDPLRALRRDRGDGAATSRSSPS